MTTPTKTATSDISSAETLTRTPATTPVRDVPSPGNPGGGLRHLAAHVGMWTIAGVGALGAAIGMVPALVAAGVGTAAVAGGYAATKVWRTRSASKGRTGSHGALGARNAGGRQGRGLLGGGKNAGARGGSGPLAGLKGKGSGSRGSRPGLLGKLAGFRKNTKGHGVSRPGGKAGNTGKGSRLSLMRKGPGALAGKGRAGKGMGKSAGLGGGKGSKSGKPLWPSKGSKAGGGSGSGIGRGVKKLRNAGRKAVRSKALGALGKFFGSSNKPVQAPEVKAPQVPEVVQSPNPSTTQSTSTSRSDQHKPIPTQGGKMGAINDAAEGVFSAVARADMGSARKLDALFGDVAEAEATIAKAKSLLGKRVTDEFKAADPGVSELIMQQAATQAKFANDAKALKAHLRRAHHTDWERLENPRNEEQHWDHRTNNQE